MNRILKVDKDIAITNSRKIVDAGIISYMAMIVYP